MKISFSFLKKVCKKLGVLGTVQEGDLKKGNKDCIHTEYGL